MHEIRSIPIRTEGKFMKTILFLLLVGSICCADDEERNTYIYNYYYNIGSSIATNGTSQSGVADMMALIYMASKGEYKNNLSGGCTYKTVEVKLSNGTTTPYYYCN